MSRPSKYRVPDIIDVIYDDVVYGLYSSAYKDNRVLIAKINLACDFLMSTDLTEEEIVKKVDIYDIEIFREFFKIYLGITPHIFRERFSR